MPATRLRRQLSRQPPEPFKRRNLHAWLADVHDTGHPEAGQSTKAKPAAMKPGTHFRVREDKVDAHGKVTLRYMSKLHHIGLGRAHKGRPVKLLIADQSIRVIALDGELIRDLTLDPSRDYQPLQRP